MLLYIIIIVLLLIHYIYFLNKILVGLKRVSRPQKLLSENIFLSVIIPFRNESKNILNSLNSLTSQSLPNHYFEVIYVDDNSDDDTYEILREANKSENIFILKSEVSIGDRAHKKKALMYAIEQVKGSIIVTTDADCTHSNSWLETMKNCFDEKTAFVSGPVQFTTNNSLFHNLQKLEFSSLILVGAGLIGSNFPIICNGANIAYRKSVYAEVGGFKDNINVSSGDDEFLMQKISNETDYKIKFCFEQEALTFTEPNNTLKEFYQQRKRWASKGFYYTNKKIVITLILIFLFYISIPFQFILGVLFNNIFLLFSFMSLLIKSIFEYRIVQFGSNKLFGKVKFHIFIISEIFHIPYIIISGVMGIFGNYKWKERKIRR